MVGGADDVVSGFFWGGGVDAAVGLVVGTGAGAAGVGGVLLTKVLEGP